jgi:hypothetical protein
MKTVCIKGFFSLAKLNGLVVQNKDLQRSIYI